MPTAEEIGARVKAAKPELKKFSDKDVGERILKAHPELAGEVKQQARPYFDPQNPMAGVPPSSIPVAGLGGGMATQQTAKDVQAAAKTGEKVMREGVGAAAVMAPFAAAAPFTGGASIPAGAGIMGLAGLTGGGLSQITDKVFGGENKSAGKIAGEVVLSGLYGAVQELTLAPALKYGGKLLDSVLMRAANKSAAGTAVLTDMTQKAYGALKEAVGVREADPTPVYRAFLKKIEDIPVGEGPVGSKLAGKVSGTVGDLANRVRSELELDPLVGSRTKPLDVLIRMHSEANQIAFSPMKDIPAPARAAAKDFANDLRGAITKELSPAERKLFEAAKSIDKAQMEFSTGNVMARFLVRKALVGSLGALAAGGTGFAEGVAADAAFQMIEQKAAPAILEHMVTKNRAAYQKAIKLIHENPEDLPKIVSEFSSQLLKGVPTRAFNKLVQTVEPKEAPDAANQGQK